MSHFTAKPIAFFLALAALATGIWLALNSRPTSEPSIAGQPLSVHLRNQTYGDVRIDRAAKEAIRDLGSNAVPFLIGILEERESRFTKALRIAAENQRLLRLRFTPLSVRQSDAALACEELGPVAAPATPALSRLLNDPLVAPAAIAALAQIGPQNLPLLTNVLQNSFDNARLSAAGHLRHLRPADQVVAALKRAMSDPHPLVRSRAAESLGTFACEAERVVPILAAALDDDSPGVRACAAQSLGWLGRDAASTAPKLREKLAGESHEAAASHMANALKSIEPPTVDPE